MHIAYVIERNRQLTLRSLMAFSPKESKGELLRSRGYIAFKMENSASISCYKVLKIVNEQGHAKKIK